MIQLLIGIPVMALVLYLVMCFMVDEAQHHYTPAWARPGIFLIGIISCIIAFAVILILTYGIGSAIWIILGHIN